MVMMMTEGTLARIQTTTNDNDDDEGGRWSGRVGGQGSERVAEWKGGRVGER